MNFYDYIDLYDSLKNENNLENNSEFELKENNENEEEKKYKNDKKKKKSMSWKSILFFIVLFAILVFGYYFYDTFLYFFPINWIFKFFFAIAGLLAILFPVIINKIKAGYKMDDVKNFMIKKYSRRPHYYQNLNSPIL
jgi:hypothetical protein